MSRKKEELWPALEHTIAKIEILRAYLAAYFAILGGSFPGKDLMYIDGFAGPGEYTNYPEGSPIVALMAAHNAIDSLGDKWKANRIHCTFIENSKPFYDHLVAKLGDIEDHPLVTVTTYNSTFIEGMKQTRSDFAALQRRENIKLASLFAFIDPFGATGVPFEFVESILLSPRAEVFINLDADGAARIFRAHAKSPETKAVPLEGGHPELTQSTQNAENLDSLLGDNEWTELHHIEEFEDQCRFIHDFYVARLRSIRNVKYVFSFEMRSRGGNINYYLVFATTHPLGLIKMKEAMRRIDRTGAYSFVDPQLEDKGVESAQILMFDDQSTKIYDDPTKYAPRILEAFAGKVCSFDEVRDYVLNFTPFITINRPMTILEKSGHIKVTRLQNYGRADRFGQAIVKSIQFAPYDKQETPYGH